jgi:hypothetical protein
MKTARQFLSLVVPFGFSIVAASCGSSGSAVAPSDAAAPTIQITSPADNGSVSIVSSTDVPVVFTVTDFTLDAPPTGCGGVNSDNCGHVHVFVDGMACDAPSTATATAFLGFCATAAGMHTIKLELHRNDHSAVTGTPSSSITITANGTD